MANSINRFSMIAVLLTAVYADAKCSAVEYRSYDESDKVIHLFVVRRNLDIPGKPRVGVLAHSAVLLKTEKEEFYLLEYLGDSNAHLNRVTFTVNEDNDDHLIVKMNGYSTSTKKMQPYLWTRQKIGVKLDGSKSAAELKKLMQGQMKEYSVWKSEHCHAAQERLRKKLGVFKE